MKETAVIIQARMDSTRLPRKIMKKIMGKPMIEYLIERISKSNFINDTIVATSNRPNNMELIQFLKSKGINYYVGDEQDVLGRYYLAAKKFRVKNLESAHNVKIMEAIVKSSKTNKKIYL